MGKISIMGIDLAKSVFQVCAMDKRGRVLFNKKIQRNKLLGFVEKQEWEGDASIAMETCGGSHHAGRLLGGKGYRVKLINAKFVKPFVKSNKNDAKDAEAIAEAASRRNMRFVGLKTVEQQDIQSIHRVRAGYIKRRTAVGNEIRGLLLEYGITVPKGAKKLKGLMPGVIEDVDNKLTIHARETMRMLYEELVHCFDKTEELENRLEVFLKAGAVVCWGYGANGQLGNDNNYSVQIPVDVKNEDGGSGVLNIGTKNRYACGDVRCAFIDN